MIKLAMASLAGVAALCGANPALAVTTLDYTGNAFTTVGDPSLGTSLDALVTLNETLPSNYTGSVDSNIQSITMYGVGSTDSASYQAGDTDNFPRDIVIQNGQVIRWQIVLLDSNSGDRFFTQEGGDSISQDGGASNSIEFSANDGVWTINPSAVPEPSTWVLMLTGFGLIGYAMRKRARVTVAYA